MQVVLVMFRGEGERRSFSIVRDVTVIGRREDCDFRIPLGEISRKHCRLIKEGNTLRAEDLGSSNGTYVNGIRVQEAELSPGDTLKVGSVVFMIQIDGVPSEHELSPAAPAVSDSAMAMSAPSEEHDMLNPTAQSEAGHNNHDPAVSQDIAAHAGDMATLDEDLSHDGLAADHEPSAISEAPEEVLEAAHGQTHTDEEYDPMSILGADPESSSVGSMIEDDDRIAEDLIIELESNERGQHPNQNG